MPPDVNWIQLEQLEHLHSEDTICHPMTTHTNDSKGSQAKTWQSQSYQFKESDKTSNICISRKTIHALPPPKLFDMNFKYEMELASIVEDTEQTQFCPLVRQTGGQTDERTDRQTDRQGETSITQVNFIERGV